MIQCKTSKEIGGMGHSKKRKEDGRFIQGKGNYVDDIKLPGMLYMDIVRSPYAYAKIKDINIEEAMKVPGFCPGHFCYDMIIACERISLEVFSPVFYPFNRSPG